MIRKTLTFFLMAALLFSGGCGLRVQRSDPPEAEKNPAPAAPAVPMPTGSEDASPAGAPTTVVLAEYLTFEEAVSRSTDVVVAVCREAEEAGGTIRRWFAVQESLKGSGGAERICVYDEKARVEIDGRSLAYVRGEYPFAPGERYLLVLERHRWVFYEEDRYLLLGDVFLPLDSPEEGRMYGEPIREHWACPAADSPEEITDYVRCLIAEDKAEQREYDGVPFIRAGSFAQAEEAADLVLLVRADSLMLAGRIAPTETFACRILDCRTGDLSYLGGDTDVLITFFAGTVQTGGEYWVCVNKPDETSRIFVPVSRENSLREADN